MYSSEIGRERILSLFEVIIKSVCINLLIKKKYSNLEVYNRCYAEVKIKPASSFTF